LPDEARLHLPSPGVTMIAGRRASGFVRYSKMALLVFGAGVVLGLAVVVGEIRWPARLASGLMALGILGLPVGLIADARQRFALPTAAAPARRSRRPSRRPRPRKSASARR
jgi:hypothetical protein